MKPLIVINLKTYKQGESVIKLAKIIKSVDKNIILGSSATDIYELSKKTHLNIYSQHVDYMDPGRNTGFILPEGVKKDGAIGSFLNHSEHKLSFDIIKKAVARCKKLKLKTMVFAGSIKEAKRIEKLKPDYIIYEPPELVAGKVSVSESRPEIISKITKIIKTPILVGAGVHSSKDLKIAMKLGAKGIALSSAVTTAKDPKKVLKELLS
ncbi:Triosephosphate isomerase [uncultured archaeon]|nr:Triosephosphate isomerase [uncultured archaeon]